MKFLKLKNGLFGLLGGGSTLKINKFHRIFWNEKRNKKSGVIGGCYLQKFKRERIGQLLQGVGGVHCLIEDGRQVVGVLDEDHHPCDTLVQTVRRHQSQVVLIFFDFVFVCVLCVCVANRRGRR